MLKGMAARPGDALRSTRVPSIDLLRGLVIVIMALDHVHDFFGDLTAQPTNLATTTGALFFTRWITHFCAPVFSLLTGTGAYLACGRMSKPQLSRFLCSRGLWLIFLELVVMRFALQFNFDYHTTIITVLWALGWSMLILAGLIWLPLWAIILSGVVLVAGHNALDGVNANALGRFAPVWTVLHAPGILINSGRSVVVVSYVLVPWIGVTALGYALGSVSRRMGRRAADDLPALVDRTGDHVSALPVVSPSETYPRLLVVDLSLKGRAAGAAGCHPRKIITTTGPDSVDTTTSLTKPARAYA
jgi:uncharacterized membrane protein